MPRRYLFGPVTADFARDYLAGPRAAGCCLAFDPQGATDLALGWHDSWEAIQARLPAGWQPDFIVLHLAYHTIPPGLWAAPVPLIAWAADWNLHWHTYRRHLRRAELVLADTVGVDALARAGLRHARAANLHGCGRSHLDRPLADAPRDIDVLFVGNLHPAVQRERLPWLGRLASLGDRWRVVIRTGVFGAAYRDLLRRARVVFNRSIRGEANQRAFEAAAAGALLFQEADNRELPAYFRDRQEYVAYTAENLEALLEHYLTHEDERQALAAAAQRRAVEYTFERLWEPALARIEAEGERLQERARQRPRVDPAEDLLARCGQAQSSVADADPALVADLAAALARRPQAAALHNALGLAVALAGAERGVITAPLAEQAMGHFRRALACDPAHVVAGLNLAEALMGVEQAAEAIAVARHTLAVLDSPAELGPEVWDAGHFPPGFDHFRVEWERAGWANAGNPPAEVAAKRALLRWRLHALLAELTDDPAHAYEAALARPDLPPPRAALGMRLARAGRPAEALSHLRQAAGANPFDADAACALFHVLGALGDQAGQHRLIQNRRRLARAAPQVVPAEDWFAERAPAGDEVASVIILCHNQLAYTRLCLESVLRYTRPPYELILVDNGSTDGTPAYLQEVASRPGPVRVEVIRNATNRGFPAGCNQGLAAARGDYLVLLNNDTIVTEGWLEGLVAWAVHDWPQVGLVGAVSNYAPPPQQIAGAYDRLEDLPAFAERRRQQFAGQAVQVDRLTGFCLLVRRAVIERVGGLDEGYGLGFFDDDDLCVRARQAGFRLLVALNVFVHHFGSRTFAELGIDCRQQLQANFARFQAKWGPEYAAGYHLPEPPPPPAPADALTALVAGQQRRERPRVSLCLIVKDEEANLPACLGSVADLVDEIIVVDTGSTDRTKEIAARCGARVFDFPWVDSFAAARNESLRHASGDWVFWLDADDRLDEDNRHKLRALFARLGRENVGYVMKCLCLPDPASHSATVVDHVRLFPRHPELRWQYRVHEQILPALRRRGGEVRWTDVVIHHAGYQDPALRGRKLERDLRLLNLEHAEHPDDPFTLFNLGSVYQELGKAAEALPLLRRSLELSHPSDSIVRKLYALIVQCHRQLGQSAEALAACQNGRKFYPNDIELLFLEGLAWRERGELAPAEACLLRLLQTPPEEHFASVDAGLRGYKARHNLALVYREQGRNAEAKAQWRAALEECPDFAPAWLGLGEVGLAQGQWGELDFAAQRLAADPLTRVEAAVLRARGHLARQEFTLARRILEETIARAPEALWPRVILSHVLLQEEKDWEAAEQALRDVLVLDPQHAEARHNLAVLLGQRGRAVEEAFATDQTLDELYQAACQTVSDFHEHLPKLCALARECAHITVLGIRAGLALTALLYARPERVVCYDTVRPAQLDALRRVAGRTELVFQLMDGQMAEIAATDLLLLDSRRDYEQRQEELRRHAGKVRRYLVLPGTSRHGYDGETAGQPGIWPAVQEFLAAGTFRLQERLFNNNGLTVLEAVANKAAPPAAVAQGDREVAGADLTPPRWDSPRPGAASRPRPSQSDSLPR
jgi:GT2 family glycosyltransferase/Tfp pilus assembly protein PilF